MRLNEVVTNPLGLAAYALALVFAVAGVKQAAQDRRWILPVAVALAALAIVGGLFLSFRDVKSQGKITPSASPQEQSAVVNQETHGPLSPAVHGVGGNVTINQNQGRSGE